MLQQALLNLALNACQAMPDGGTLKLICRPASRRRVEIVVEDTGVGIPPENLGRIFDLYFTTKETGQRHRPLDGLPHRPAARRRGRGAVDAGPRHAVPAALSAGIRRECRQSDRRQRLAACDGRDASGRWTMRSLTLLVLLLLVAASRAARAQRPGASHRRTGRRSTVPPVPPRDDRAAAAAELPRGRADRRVEPGGGIAAEAAAGRPGTPSRGRAGAEAREPARADDAGGAAARAGGAAAAPHRTPSGPEALRQIAGHRSRGPKASSTGSTIRSSSEDRQGRPTIPRRTSSQQAEEAFKAGRS